MAGKSKAKTITIRVYEDSEEYKWIQNQEKVSPSIRRAIKLIISRYGTGDLIESILDDASLDYGGRVVREPQETVSTTEQTVETKDAAPKIKSNMRLGSHKTEESDNGNIDGKLKNKPNFDMLS
ncbi:hypothetical protein [Limosilactobacillus reuteri]|uniref:hypothetical protein n=1 Tax=Limosilactobacillus reuteri TaxID=1598 RepID=UPI001E53E79E|nr:hypothetical protein [Limosilactobacillus reuteri]MCC4466864.1 hypothetical protein [Limosilactobacillus reuteri]MCC4472890.1 hypothetical protein [Limosilactobacillus reuteri]